MNMMDIDIILKTKFFMIRQIFPRTFCRGDISHFLVWSRYLYEIYDNSVDKYTVYGHETSSLTVR